MPRQEPETVTAGFDILVIAGWTGRDTAALERVKGRTGFGTEMTALHSE